MAESALSARRAVEPWYLSYASLGISAAGMAPILLPLAVGRTATAADIGLVMGAFNLGGLTAPLWGELADHRRLHRLLLSGGLAVTAVAMAAFPLLATTPDRLLLSLLQGTGAAAAGTVANLFIVEAHPRSEWDKRIGWLQTFYGGGQVIGLLLAGVLSTVGATAGLYWAAGVTVLGVFPAWFLTRTPNEPADVRPVLRHPARHAEISPGSPQRTYHFPTRATVAQAMRSIISPFGIFLSAWIVSFAGAAAFFALYPVLMQKLYGITPEASAGGFAVAAGAGLLLYAPAGRWSARFGGMRVLQGALLTRIAVFAGLFAVDLLHVASAEIIALGAFAFLVLAWSPLSVSGTALAAELADINEGESLGLFNAATAVAGTLGALGGGWLASAWGYDSVALLGAVAVAAGAGITTLTGVVRRKRITATAHT